MSSAGKVYCECSRPKFEAYGLFGAGLTKKNTIQFVHSCGKPFPLVWRRWLEMCPICLGLFSSPWSLLCRQCHREESPSATFKGWSWARETDRLSRINRRVT